MLPVSHPSMSEVSWSIFQNQGQRVWMMSFMHCGLFFSTYAKTACTARIFGCCLHPRVAGITVSMDVYHQKKNGQRDLFFLILMYDTGARAQEMLDLQIGDMKMDENNPYVIITGKGSKTRLVPIMEKTCRHFEAYRSRFHPSGNPDEYLFYVDRKGARTKMSIDNVEKFVARYGKKAREQLLQAYRGMNQREIMLKLG